MAGCCSNVQDQRQPALQGMNVCHDETQGRYDTECCHVPLHACADITTDTGYCKHVETEYITHYAKYLHTA